MSEDWSLDLVYEKLRDDEINLDTTFQYVNPATNKTIKLSLGRIWFNLLLPESFRLVNEPVNKDICDKIIKEILENYDTETASKHVTLIQKEAFKLATINPCSFSIEGFIPSEEWTNKKDKFIKEAPNMSDEDYEAQGDELMNELLEEMREKNVSILNGFDAKISGKFSPSLFKRLNVTRGDCTDMEGEIKRVVNSLNDGYSIEEHYTSSADARFGQYCKAVAVQQPGYLSRKVVMSSAGLKQSGSDCGSTRYVNIFANEQRAKFLIGRYFLNEKTKELEEIKDVDQILNKKIQLRSPIFCLQKDGICKTCYGKLAETLGSNNVGIIAGGAINDAAVNSMMKLRHQTSKSQTVKVDFSKILKESTIDRTLVDAYLNVEKTKITTKDNITIIIDLKDYNKNEFRDYSDHYYLPGLINIQVGNGKNAENITLPYTFYVKLSKPQTTEKDGSTLYLQYEKNVVLIEQEKYVKNTDSSIVSKLLDGVTKYINDPEILLQALTEEMSSIDSVHFETIISNMFRSKNDETVLGRHVNYKNVKIVGCKQLPHIDSWLTSLAFEDINKSIKQGLVNNKQISNNPIEQTMLTGGVGN